MIGLSTKFYVITIAFVWALLHSRNKNLKGCEILKCHGLMVLCHHSRSIIHMIPKPNFQMLNKYLENNLGCDMVARSLQQSLIFSPLMETSIRHVSPSLHTNTPAFCKGRPS